MQGLLKPRRQSQADQPQVLPESPEDAIKQGMDEEDGLDESHPAFQAHIDFIGNALYEQGLATKFADVMGRKQMPIEETMANISYEMMEIAGEKSGEPLPPELVALFASAVLEQMTEVARAAGVEVAPADIASAFKLMILRFLGEQGMDTTELQQAMDQVDPQVFNQAAAAEEMGDEQRTA